MSPHLSNGTSPDQVAKRPMQPGARQPALRDIRIEHEPWAPALCALFALMDIFQKPEDEERTLLLLHDLDKAALHG